MPKVKIAMIGAGSAAFTARLVGDVLQAEELEGSTLHLMDIDPSVLPTVRGLAERMVEQAGRDFTIEAGTSRARALEGADFVTATIAVGGLDAWAVDATLPEKFGVLQPVGDSVGPGGLSRALRQVPATLKIAQDMERYCPGAYLINYSNPMSANCLAVQRYTAVPTIGLCHGTPNVAQQMAGWFGVGMEDVEYLAAGVNHLTWYLEFHVKGKDCAGKLDRVFEKRGLRKHMPVSCSLYDRFGRFPSPGDCHVAEFFTDYLRPEKEGSRAASLHFRDFPAMRKSRSAERRRVKRLLSGKGQPDDLMRGSGESAVSIMLSLLEGRNEVHMANLPNEGILDNAPQGLLAEVPAVFGKRGIVPLPIGKLPDGIAAVTSLHMHVAHLVVEAALKGDRQLALQATLMDPLSKNSTDPEGMLDALLKAHEAYLPQFRKRRGRTRAKR